MSQTSDLFLEASGLLERHMKTTVQQTSLMSYQQLRSEGEIGRRQSEVLGYIRRNPGCSDRDISKGLALPINMITGRRNELQKLGLISEDGLAYDAETRRNVLRWKADY